MPVLTDLASAEVKRTTKKLFGQTLTRPTLTVSEGLNAVYAVDVNIGPTDPTGMINQYFKQKKDGTLDTNDDNETESGDLTGLPGQPPEDWQLDDSLPGHVDTTLHNVVLSRNNKDLIYADVGAPVIVERNDSGNWMVTGFSLEIPGTHRLYPVSLSDMTIGTVMDLSIGTRLLTLAEIGELQPFGSLPFGASAIYQGSELLNIV